MGFEENKIFAGLNDKQIEAVRAMEGPVLILAGAGSGKTKALTHRIAFLISSGTKAHNILAITFTNRAANEIKERVARLLKGASTEDMPFELPVMGTFHSICLQILRQEANKIDYSRNFIIYDDDDQLSAAKNLMRELEIDPKKISPKSMLGKISNLKSELVGAEEFADKAKEFSDKRTSLLYLAYQNFLKNNNGLDFDDLIMLCVELFRKNPEVLEKYQEVFKYILVDEYQDTNHAQYVWVNLLAQKHRNLFVIGDDAQSIYGWRNADIRNILDFEKDYPEAKVIKLEQNYRSTKKILEAANNVIANNKMQKPKTLWTKNTGGEKIILKQADNEQDEAGYIVDIIQKGQRLNIGLNNFTILYRTHAQSRALEEAMIGQGLPYKILGGVKFYQRREIKDILAYLRLCINQNDGLSFERIYNVPGRGIGKSSFEKIKSGQFESVGKKQLETLNGLKELLTDFHKKSGELGLSDLVDEIIKRLDYESYINDKTGDGEERWENVKELFTATKKYDTLKPPEGLERFLEEVALIQETDKLNSKHESITLMTVHSAKGLEFPIVFIAGMEEGIFPHSSAMFDPVELEEERRLCYVGITRAKDRLYLVFCRRRNIYGKAQLNSPSRFLFEIPEHLIRLTSTEKNGKNSYIENVFEY